ncbi:MAG: CopG family transcriptional regulator [Candidatus Aenigmarchaeota archaeon]|nr:CopG family transcriptional regulator [Candidatus Aenigmarchaeota archaeon]
MPERKHTTVSIPITMYKKIEEMIEDTGFSSVSGWVSYVLREVLINMKKEERKDAKVSEEDEKKIKERLRALGYL